MLLNSDCPAFTFPAAGHPVELEFWVTAVSGFPPGYKGTDRLHPSPAHMSRLYRKLGAARQRGRTQLVASGWDLQRTATFRSGSPRHAERKWMVAPLPQAPKWIGRDGVVLKLRTLCFCVAPPAAVWPKEERTRRREEQRRKGLRRSGAILMTKLGAGGPVCGDRRPELTSGLQRLCPPPPAAPLHADQRRERKAVEASLRVTTSGVGGSAAAYGQTRRERTEALEQARWPAGADFEEVDGASFWEPTPPPLQGRWRRRNLRSTNPVLAALMEW
eukprot:TRINITY_DN8096_c1_g2_i4.p1 TRINITY_DN8096_c1_g2~~TRINITY_DN8096_c1_g2_i4.p1  ORF type:complete len:274 (+),score=9.16 TRINITY_DN8096_c1_g2_i4:680-1501(+)